MANQILKYLSGEIPISKTRIYKIHQGMKQRCYNPNNQHFPSYGGRGITICPEWLDEDGICNFMMWSLHNGYADDLTIDRKDNNKGYSPDNCQWVTASFNASKGNSDENKTNRQPKSAGEVVRQVMQYKNVTQPKLAKILGINTQSVANKIQRGNMSVQNFLNILNALDCEVYIQDENNDSTFKLS